MKFGLMLFGDSQYALDKSKYNLVIETARFADSHEFSSIWTPERHFAPLGGLYPNPSVLNAALARETQQVRLQSGSVVLPLHHPIRIAEEWSIVDNLSGGRVGLSFASGWSPDNFAFFPEKYQNRHEELFVGIETVRKLWQGESIRVKSGNGKLVDINVYPQPVQAELPIWVTAVGNPQTFAKAGEIGANLLTNLFTQSIEELAEKITIYRQARSRYGHEPDTGIVSLMLHTFVGENVDLVREQIRIPYCKYLKSNSHIFLQGVAQARGYNVELAKLSEKDLDNLVNFIFERFASTSGLIGTPETCLELIEQLDSVGVSEIVSLLDFGQAEDIIINNLPYLNQLREKYTNEIRRPKHLDYPLKNPTQRVLNGRERILNKKQSLSDYKTTLSEIKTQCREAKDPTEFDQLLAQNGIQKEASSKTIIKELWLGKGEALGKVEFSGIKMELDRSFQINPSLLNACDHVLGAALLYYDDFSDENLQNHQPVFYLPVGCKSCRVHRTMGNIVWSHAVVQHPLNKTQEIVEGDVRIFDEEGNLLVEVSGLQMQQTNYLANSINTQNHYKDWFYQLQWQPKPLSESELVLKKAPGSWLILADSLGVGEKLGELLEERGERCFIVRFSETYRISSEELLIEQVFASEQLVCRGVIHLWSLDTINVEETNFTSLKKDQTITVTSILNLVQALINRAKEQWPCLWFVTQNVQKIGSEVTPPSLAQAPVWGLGKVIRTELPHVVGGLIDLDKESSIDEAANQLLRELIAPDGEDLVVFRDRQRYVERLVRSQNQSIKTKPISFRSDATYLITGGLGRFGLQAAYWMAQQGAKNLVFINRRELSSVAWEVIRPLQELGAKVLLLKADVADPEAMSKVFEQIDSSCPPLGGILHAAGILGSALIEEITPDTLEAMLSPKVFGVWNLHQLTKNKKLDFFISTSSMTAVWGSKGEGHYAAANYFLNVFAHYRHSLGLPALTINMGLLDIPQGDLKSELYNYELLGEKLLKPKDAFAALEQVLAGEIANQVIVDINWSVFKELYQASTGRLLLEQIETQPIGMVGQQLKSRDLFWQEWESAPVSDRHEYLITYLQKEVAQVLGYLGEKVLPSPEQGFFEMGMDSLLAIELKNRLSASLGYELPTVLIFEQPNILSLADYIAQEVLHWHLVEETNLVSALEDDDEEISYNIKQLSKQNLENLINQELEELMEYN
ncbi:MAG: LLM class flavin-dependent oxidoreductase [Komarekiella atlantica HA4396-MV6]|jgi:natural product biosynthesis luciferase-like monooxygenase protein|nr:LLM class flavin-dependent oxidoreductase [Komarekiella atlantica HA4396-MV6]